MRKVESSKAGKKSSKAGASTRPNRSRSRGATAAPVLLSAEERRRLLKPREHWDELARKLVRTLQSHPNVRIEGLSAQRLERLLERALAASRKEDELRDALERRLAVATDRRLLAQDALWRAILDVNAGIKPYARKDGSIADAFAFLTAALSGGQEERKDAGGTDGNGTEPPREPG